MPRRKPPAPPPRRARGTGAVFPRKDGRWVARLAGRKDSYHPTRAGAERELADVLARRRRGLPDVADETLGSFLDRYVGTMAPTWPENTAHGYGHHLGLFREIYDVPLAELRAEHVQRELARLLRVGRIRDPASPLGRAWVRKSGRTAARARSRGLAPNTVAAALGTLRRALDTAIDWELIGRNPTRGVRPPRVEPPELPIWTPEQAGRFARAARGHRFEAAFRLASDDGLRMGELIALRWEDVDLAAGLLRVRRGEAERTRRVGPTKQRRARTVVLSAASLRALILRRDAQPPGCAWVWEKWPGGPRWQAQTIRLDYGRLCGELGVPRVRVHDARHLHATTLLQAGIPGATVAERLGHANPAVTHAIYSHAVEGDQRRAVELMGSLFDDDGADPGPDPGS